MSLTDSISGDLQAIHAGVDAAQQEAAAVDQTVEQIAARAAAAGFVGITVGLARVREAIGQARAQLTTVCGVSREASRSIASVPQQPSPQETIDALKSVMAALSSVDNEITAAAARIEEARQLAMTALQGGQPGPTLARLQQLNQRLAAIRAREGEARHHAETALTQAQQVGELGN
ncbi:hypothetical protein GCM10027290_34700 [Micromonospora sonneratiae]|uniref:DUF6244 family protein n=1 Tax=Micromonospora sonneratiae TaxID=1184706 RepID=A0ABW3YQA1_9ACTN